MTLGHIRTIAIARIETEEDWISILEWYYQVKTAMDILNEPGKPNQHKWAAENLKDLTEKWKKLCEF